MLTRKPAMAAALALTAILGFAVVAFGAQRGIFAWTQGTQSEAAREVEIPEENPLAGWPQATPPVIEIQPVEVVTEYQITDQVVAAPPAARVAAAPAVAPAPAPTEPATAVSAPTRAAATTPADAPTSAGPSDDAHEDSDDDEHEDEDEDEREGGSEHEDSGGDDD
jgi:hypothetical protein